MDWQKCMNQAMEYIESHLAGRIDYAKAAQYLQCSEQEFRRIFSVLTQVPLSEYIRRRRLTMAAEDISRGERLIDVAMRYGYESQAAFSRAFRQFHGITPSQAKGLRAELAPYPRLSFRMALMESGGLEAVTVSTEDPSSDAINAPADAKQDECTLMDFWELAGDVCGKCVLEIGCQNRMLPYPEGAAVRMQLRSASMQEQTIMQPGQFDLVCSPCAVGRTEDLEDTFERIASCLKKDGMLIFGWSDPAMPCSACTVEENTCAAVCGEGGSQERKTSGYVNALAKSGFVIEEMVERPQEYPEPILPPGGTQFPVEYIIRARKG